jgi:2-dehydro-3-deoxygluconokinase
MAKEFDLLSFGEALLRLSPPDNERVERGEIFRKTIGGAELNVVSGVSMLGLRTGLISKLPANLLGTYAKNWIRFCGVSDDYLVYDQEKDARLGLYYYESADFPRKPRIVYDRRGSSINTVSIEDFPQSMYASTRCFHTTGITLALSENCRKTAVEMIRRFKQAGALISFDVNFRANLWTGPEAKKCIEEILPYVDIFFCSEDTARLTFLKEGDAHEIMKSFAKEYPLKVIASTKRIVHSPKRHTFGSTIYDCVNDRFYEEEPYRNIEVVDRIGSGDAYISGVLYGMLASGSVETAMQFGNAASAIKCTIPGDLPSLSMNEIQSVMKDHEQGSSSEMDR